MYVSEDEATQWLKSVGLSFFFTYIILNPLIIAFFNCVLLLLATTYLGKTGILERLTDPNTAVEYFAQHGMSAAVVGTAGVVKVTCNPQQVVPHFMIKKEPGKSKVMPIVHASSGITTEVTPISYFMDEAQFHESTNELSAMCICKTLVPNAQLDTHRTTIFSHRSVTCPVCSLKMPGFLLSSHTDSMHGTPSTIKSNTLI